jgi:hypothetical protein
VQQEAQAIFTRLSPHAPLLLPLQVFGTVRDMRVSFADLLETIESAQRAAAIIVISSVVRIHRVVVAGQKSKVKRSSSLGTLSNILIRVLFLRMPGRTYRAA